MTTFVLAAILIILAVLALLTWPLLFTRNTYSYERHAQNIHYAKERLAELEDQLKNASISATDYEALKLEIETTLAQDIDLANSRQEQTLVQPRRPNKLAISLLCLFIPLSAAGVYSVVGTPAALSSQNTPSERPSADQISSMIEGLEQKLATSPEDIEGWTLLSRTYFAVGQFGKARDGLKRVIELGGASAENYATLADASARAANGNLSGEPTEYSDKALQLDANNQQALWLRGLAAVQAADVDTAKLRWGHLVTLLDGQPQEQAKLQQIMAEAINKIASEAPMVKQSSESQAATPADPGSAAGVTAKLSISPSIADKINANDTIFVFAKAKNGPPAPLAVKRIQASSLPTTVMLSDNDAMMPQFKMSLFEDIVVSARVSKSGQPIAQAGDYESQKVDVKQGREDDIELIISGLVE